MNLTLTPIATLHNNFPEKFGLPRQSGLINSLRSRIVFAPEFRQAEALRGLEGYSHLWLIWHFSDNNSEGWSPTVRPPRLGGNKRMGVFATRSPFRPNPIGLSCVKIEAIRLSTPEGPVIEVSGADLKDGTPIFDLKPYLPHIDAHPDAAGGFAVDVQGHALDVEIPTAFRQTVDDELLTLLREVLAQDPRPSYQQDPERIYALQVLPYEIKFQVKNNTAVVTDMQKI